MLVKINIETLGNLTNEQCDMLNKLNSTITTENLKKYSELLKAYGEYENKNKDRCKSCGHCKRQKTKQYNQIHITKSVQNFIAL